MKEQHFITNIPPPTRYSAGVQIGKDTQKHGHGWEEGSHGALWSEL